MLGPIKIHKIGFVTKFGEYFPNLEKDINDWLSFKQKDEKKNIEILTISMKDCCLIFYTEE